jgi:PST family polysaccharide transporter
MSLQNALGWSSIGAAVRIALGFFSAKVSAIYLGPAGMVLVGQVNNFMQVTAGAIGNGANTAVVNLTAERAADRAALPRLWASAMRLVLAVAGLTALAAGLAAGPLSEWLFFSREFWPVVVVAGLVIVLAVADNVVTGALNGLKQVDAIARAGIVSSVIEFAGFVSMTWAFGVWGALLAMTGVYGTRLAVSSTIAFRSGLVRPRDLFGAVDGDAVRAIGRFYPMLLAHSIALPLGLLLVRHLVVGAAGLEQAGFLQAAWRLSDVYVTVLTTALGLYFMAQFSSLGDEAERGALLRRTVVQVAAVTALAALGIYLLRDLVVRVVLTREFLPMTALLPFQLAGDVLKMACYPLQMALVSRRRVSVYIAQAIGAPALYVLLAAAGVPALGVTAAPLAYACAYGAVFVGLLFALRSTLLATPAAVPVAEHEQLAV